MALLRSQMLFSPLQGSSAVLVASTAAYSPEPPISLYGVTKASLVSLGRALANELGPDGIRVNSIAPGPSKLSFLAQCEGHTHVLDIVKLGKYCNNQSIARTSRLVR